MHNIGINLNLQLHHKKAYHVRGGTRKIYQTGKKQKSKYFYCKRAVRLTLF